MNVESIMSNNVQVCRRDQSALSALLLMREHDFGCLPVTDHGKLVGVVTDRDIALAMADSNKSPSHLQLSQVMSRDVHSVRPNSSVGEAESLMRQYQIRRVPVVDGDNHPIGMLSLNDIARAGSSRTWKSDSEELSAPTVASTLAAICQPQA